MPPSLESFNVMKASNNAGQTTSGETPMGQGCCASCESGNGTPCEGFEAAYNKHGAAAIRFHLLDAIGGVPVQDAVGALRDYLAYHSHRARYDTFVRLLGTLESFGALTRSPSLAELRQVTAYEETARNAAAEIEKIKAVRRGQEIDIGWLLVQVGQNWNVPAHLHSTIQGFIRTFDSRLTKAVNNLVTGGKVNINRDFFSDILPGRPSLFELEILADHLNKDLTSLNWDDGPGNSPFIVDNVANLTAHMLVRESEYLALYLTLREEVYQANKAQGNAWFKDHEGGLAARIDDLSDAWRAKNMDAPYFVQGPYDESDPGYEAPHVPNMLERLKSKIGSFLTITPEPKQGTFLPGAFGGDTPPSSNGGGPGMPTVAITPTTPSTPTINWDRLRESLSLPPRAPQSSEPPPRDVSPPTTPPTEQAPPATPQPHPETAPQDFSPPPEQVPSQPQTLPPQELLGALEPGTQEGLVLIGFYLYAACTGQLVLDIFDEPAEIASLNTELAPLWQLIGATDLCDFGTQITFAGAEMGLLPA